MDFGLLAFNSTATKQLVVVNENPVPISILAIEKKKDDIHLGVRLDYVWNATVAHRRTFPFRNSSTTINSNNATFSHNNNTTKSHMPACEHANLIEHSIEITDQWEGVELFPNFVVIFTFFLRAAPLYK